MTQIKVSLNIAGFIDFIVEPSFQVMGDMLDKILCPLRSSSGHNVDEAISEEVFDKDTVTRGTSAGKSLPKPVAPSKLGDSNFRKFQKFGHCKKLL